MAVDDLGAEITIDSVGQSVAVGVRYDPAAR